MLTVQLLHKVFVFSFYGWYSDSLYLNGDAPTTHTPFNYHIYPFACRQYAVLGTLFSGWLLQTWSMHKKFLWLKWNWFVGRGWWVAHSDVLYNLIQGQASCQGSVRWRCPKTDRRRLWTVSDRSGCPVRERISSLVTNSDHCIFRMRLRHQLSSASVFLDKIKVIDHVSAPCKNIGRTQVL